jgi:hypothetical protein
MTSRGEPFDDEVFERVCAALQVGDVISTVGISRPNWVTGINEDGILVETLRSRQMGSGPQLVPAWMINRAWHHLRKHGRLSQTQLLNELNVKRSAFVCALLARFDDVDIESDKPVVLHRRS